MKTKDMALIALFTALIAILAQVSIPLPFTPVPITGQVLGVFLAGAVLGKKNGTLSIIIYLMLGAIGLPVFARGGAGLAPFVGPTGGYLWGFILGVYAMGLVFEAGNPKEISYIRMVLGMIVCLFVVYILGTAQLMYLMHLTLQKSLLLAVIPFIPLDVAKLIVAAIVSYQVRRALNVAGYLTSGKA